MDSRPRGSSNIHHIYPSAPLPLLSAFLTLIYDLHSQPPAPPEIVDDESDTASVTSSISTSPKLQRRTKKSKYNVQPRIDTNLTSRKKEMVAKSSAVATPRLRLTTPQPYGTPRSRDPSPARGEKRWRLSADWYAVRAYCSYCEMLQDWAVRYLMARKRGVKVLLEQKTVCFGQDFELS